MKKRISNIIIGIIILAVGVILVGNFAGFWNFDIFFKGWWTVLIMAVSLISIISDKPNIFNIYFLLFGGAMLLKYCGVFGSDVSGWLIALALLIVAVGVKLIISAFPQSKPDVTSGAQAFSDSDSNGGTGNVSISFSEQNINLNGKNFTGAKYECSFGKLTVDLRGAELSDNSFLSAESVFGNITILVPSDTAVKLNRDATFGSVKCRASQNGTRTLNVNAEAVFGSVEII